MDKCDKYKELMMGLMDNELDEDETREVQSHLDSCESCRREYDEIVKAGSDLQKVTFAEADDRVLAQFWRNPMKRLAKAGSLFLVIGGYLLLIGWSVYEFLTSTEPFIPRLGMAAITVGFVTLVVLLIMERVKTSKTDKYKDVIR